MITALEERIKELQKTKTAPQIISATKGLKTYGEKQQEKLDEKLMTPGRLGERNGSYQYGVCEKVYVEECYVKTGKAPIRGRWLDINKEYRSKLVWRKISSETTGILVLQQRQAHPGSRQSISRFQVQTVCTRTCLRGRFLKEAAI